jgi:cytochrome P450
VTEASITASKYDFSSEDYFADPYPMYAQMRRDDPVYWHPEMGMWFVSRYRDVFDVCRDPRFSVERLDAFFVGVGPEYADKRERVRRFFADWLVFVDPPHHTRIRTLINKAFSPRSIAALTPYIESCVEDALDQMHEGEEVDLITTFAFPVPSHVIAHMLGVAAEDIADFERWAADVFRVPAWVGNAEENVSVAYEAVLSLENYFRRLIAERRESPREDILSALANASERGDLLTEQELVSTCAMLLVAGHETTANLIGNGILALLRNPDQLTKLHDQPQLIDAAVEEFLRYDGAATGLVRIAKADLEIGGQQIKKGDVVFALCHASNRDESVFDHPDRLDIERSDGVRNLAFGHGPHVCVGAALARLETRIAVDRLIHRFPNMRLAGDQLTWIHGLAIRGVTALPVIL